MERLRAGETVTDDEFDLEVFPDWAQAASRVHWTPVTVSRFTARLLTAHGAKRILDVGSGVGKFCLVGALTSPGVFLGIEQRPHFIQVARQAAARLGVDRCTFTLGNMTALDWSEFDAYYLYNPFAEHRMALPIDNTIQRSVRRYRKYVRFVEEQLAKVPAGILLATYHGFGGTPPAGWTQLRNEACGSGRIELWRKLST
ncbi:MAG: methyltransferase domain-containing protein [Myxococcaceae bacterium]